MTEFITVNHFSIFLQLRIMQLLEILENTTRTQWIHICVFMSQHVPLIHYAINVDTSQVAHAISSFTDRPISHKQLLLPTHISNCTTKFAKE